MFNKNNRYLIHEMEEKLSRLYEVEKAHDNRMEHLEQLMLKLRERMYDLEKHVESMHKELNELKERIMKNA